MEDKYIVREAENYEKILRQHPERIKILHKTYIQHSSKRKTLKMMEIWILSLKMIDSQNFIPQEEEAEVVNKQTNRLGEI
jgi:hypothetical protein